MIGRSAAPQTLNRTLICYRIGDPRGEFPIYDGRGAVLFPGRWNTGGMPVIYASEHYSTAMLEKLVHGNGRLPPNQHFIVITVPKGTSFEVATKDQLPGWDTLEPSILRDFGEQWLQQGHSAILLVPSFVARLETNVLVNPAHRDAGSIERNRPEPVWWDERLFR